MDNDSPLGIPLTLIFIVCVCCSRNITANDAYPVPGQPRRYKCGPCLLGVQTGCPRCDEI